MTDGVAKSGENRKKHWARRIQRLAPFDVSTAQVRLRGRTTFPRCTPGNSGVRRQVGQRCGNHAVTSFAWPPSAVPPASEDFGPPMRRFSPGPDALPPWDAVAS